MDATNRSIIAYIAGRLITGTTGWWMQDQDRHRPVSFEGSFENGEIRVYSHEQHSCVSGLGAEGKYMLYMHNVGGAVNLLVNVEERTFSGWEHRTGYHFSGDIAGRTVRLYDYQDAHWHLYTL